VGIALAERDTGRNRPVIMVVGDGSFQYSVQSIWTAGQLRLPILIVVLRNEEYCILKSFAVLEDAPGVPGLDVRGIDTFLLQRATATVLHGLTISTLLKKAATEAWTKSKPTVLEVPISPPRFRPLYETAHAGDMRILQLIKCRLSLPANCQTRGLYEELLSAGSALDVTPVGIADVSACVGAVLCEPS
jgi:thiamine pyrophosphate-dependent acetolactate synthase large subunit-like protein